MTLISKRDAFTHGNSGCPNPLPNCNCEWAHIATLVLGGYEYSSGMRVWVQPAVGPPIFVEMKVEDEGNLEWLVEEREGKCLEMRLEFVLLPSFSKFFPTKREPWEP